MTDSAYAPLSMTTDLLCLYDDGEFCLQRSQDAQGLSQLLWGASTPDAMVQGGLDNAWQLRAGLAAAGALAPSKRLELAQRPVLALPDPGGETLAQYFARHPQPAPLLTDLLLAVKLTAALAQLHRQGVWHLGLRPGHIVLGADGGIYLSSFASSRHAQSHASHHYSQSLSEDRVADAYPWLAPEQTGRVQQQPDQRSDLYALGVLLFRLFGGRLPFAAQTPLEWVHCHVARAPMALLELQPSLPQALAQIVNRLLIKDVSERYQSAIGLLADLQCCLDACLAGETIAPFSLGLKDMVDTLPLAQTLYGRSAAIAALQAAQAQAVGRTSLLLIRGASGVGKTALLGLLERAPLQPLRSASGSRPGAPSLLIQGKFDQFQRDIPYATLAHACQDLILQIATRPALEVAMWRNAIVQALGRNGALLGQLIPGLSHLLGPQAAVPYLSPSDAQNRFHAVFEAFLGVFARADQPLTLFLDDMQWIDMASLKLIEYLLQHDHLAHLRLIGAYRDGEVGPTHVLRLSLDKLAQAAVPLAEIRLEALTQEDVQALLADCLQSAPEAVEALAKLIYQKTAGNPFFTWQFIHALHADGLLLLDPQSRRWQWQLAGINSRGYTENVIDLMVDKLHRLGEESRSLLAQLACLGHQAALGRLLQVAGLPEAEVLKILWAAQAEGLLVQEGGQIRFLHDRIQEAAYSLLEPEQRGRIHLQLGRRLLAGMASELADDEVFAVVGQLNLAIDLISDPRELAALAQYNLQAGRRARNAVAYCAARSYLAQAYALWPSSAWQDERERTLDVHLELAECEFLTGNFAAAEELFVLALANSSDRFDKARVQRLRMGLYQVAGRHAEAVDIAVQTLALFDLQLSLDGAAIADQVSSLKASIDAQLGGRAIAELVQAAHTEDRDAAMLIGLLVEAMPASYNARPAAFALIVMHALDHSLKHGLSEDSAFAFSCYGLITVAVYGEVDAAYAWSEAAMQLNERFDNLRLRGMVRFVHGCFIHHWRKHCRDGPVVLEQSFIESMEAGNLLYAGFAAFIGVSNLIDAGTPLEQVKPVLQKYLSFAEHSGNTTIAHTLTVYQHLLACLQDPQVASLSFAPAQPALAALLSANYGAGIGAWHLARLMAALWLQQDTDLLALVRAAQAVQPAFMAMLGEANFYLHKGLVLARCSAEQPQLASSLRPELEDAAARLANWAQHCPDNFACASQLMAGEIAHLDGRIEAAAQAYELAISSAASAGLYHLQGLACERAAALYQASPLAARGYLGHAHACYRRWGASSLCQRLQNQHPWLQPAHAQGPDGLGQLRHLDLATVLQAAQAISESILLDRLIESLMAMALQYSAAQRGVLLLADDFEGSNLDVQHYYAAAEAQATADGIGVKLLSDSPPCTSMAPSILRYVLNTRTALTLDDASANPLFALEAQAEQLKSVLCLPLIKQARCIGLLYLENRLSVGVFTPEHRSVLGVLASQAAISLENARLYGQLQEDKAALYSLNQTLEQRVVERTRALQQSLLEQKAIFDNAVTGIAFIRDRVIQRCNAGLEQMFGYASGEMDGHSTRLLYANETDYQHYGQVAYPLMRSGSSFHDDVALIRKDGQTIWCAVHAKLLDGQDPEKGIVLVTQDISARREAAQALAAAKLQAEEATRFKSMFLANMSHEIRTPMNAIMGMSRLALNSGLNPKQRDYVEKIFGASGSLLHIINDILDFSKIEAGHLHLEQIHFNLMQVLDAVSSVITLKAQDKGLELLFRVSPEVPRSLRGDPLRLGQVIVNLANNAVKFTEQGEILLEISCEPYDGERVRLRCGVRDSGIGIASDRLEQLFSPFAQADASTTRKYGGTGLGLAISRQIVELMGGQIRAESRLGEGSLFEFTALLGLTNDAEQGSPHINLLQDARALVVDDNATARLVLVEMLAQLGLRAEVAADGASAVRMANSAMHAGDPFKLVLLDWIMPGLDGIQTARQLLAQTQSAAPMSILMVTAYQHEDAKGLAAQVGIDQVLSKPLNESVLYDAILQQLVGDDAIKLRRQVRQDPRGPASDTTRLRGARVLLAEDSPLNQQVALEFLNEVGVCVDLANNGIEALARLRAHRYDLVLMDIQMPQMDGLSAAREIRQDPRFNALPIIAMTAHAMTGDRELSLAAGMNDHVTKPIDPAALYGAMLRQLGTKPSVVCEPAPSTLPAAELARFPEHLARLRQVGIDIEAGLSRNLGRLAFYEKLLGLFAEQTEKLLLLFPELLRTGNQAELYRHMHSLKSSARTVGAQALGDLAEKLETLSQDAMPQVAEFAAMQAELTAISGPLRPFIPLDEVIPAQATTWPASPELIGLVQNLCQLLADDDAMALDLLEPLRQQLHGSSHIAEGYAIVELVEDLEYDEARIRAQTLLKKLK